MERPFLNRKICLTTKFIEVPLFTACVVVNQVYCFACITYSNKHLASVQHFFYINSSPHPYSVGRLQQEVGCFLLHREEQL